MGTNSSMETDEHIILPNVASGCFCIMNKIKQILLKVVTVLQFLLAVVISVGVEYHWMRRSKWWFPFRGTKPMKVKSTVKILQNCCGFDFFRGNESDEINQVPSYILLAQVMPYASLFKPESLFLQYTRE